MTSSMNTLSSVKPKALPKQINDLPDVCLRKIFHELPLRDFIHIDQVCSRWATLQFSVCCLKRSLTLIFRVKIKYLNFSLPSHYKITKDDGTLLVQKPGHDDYSTLRLYTLDYGLASFFASKFINLTTLEISDYNVEFRDLRPLTTLLKKLQSQLITLKLWYHFRVRAEEILPVPDAITCHFLNCLNSMSSLKHLTLDFSCILCDFTQFDEFEFSKIDLPIIGQLEEFYFCTQDYDLILWDSLVEYGEPSQTLKRIGYQFDKEIDLDDISIFYQLNPDFCAKFTHVPNPTKFIPLESGELDAFTARFISLVTLCTDTIDISLRHAFSCLSRLTQLEELILHIDYSQLSEDENPDAEFAKLPSVKLLHVEAQSHSHADLSLLNVSWTFPNLQVMKMFCNENEHRDFHCDICDYNFVNGQQENSEQVAVCSRKRLEPLKECPKLHYIKVLNNGYDFNCYTAQAIANFFLIPS